ncbi:hypothetical protein [Streptomyces sp. NPDC002889]|uniref:hypothetical protein n=1 Tax=Streptomyces sp. NPDC002889 TaxID=3364669 RepID=UPI00369055E8
MIRPKPGRRRRAERARRREEQRAQYLKQVGPLRIYLLIECAPLVVDPFDIADQAFKRAFADPDRDFAYGEMQKIAKGIVRDLKMEGKAKKVAEYSLEKIFDPYLTAGLEPVREVLRAVDGLSLRERAVIEGEFLHLLTSDYIAETIGVTQSTKRGQKRSALAKLAESNANLELLDAFFKNLRGETP